MDWLQFVIDRYNYWIVIILMMTGLYTVIARGNLVKKIIGLNLFQTSVFIFYITIGKVAGGTAPIYVPGDMEARAGHGNDGHGGGHGGDHGGDHGGSHDPEAGSAGGLQPAPGEGAALSAHGAGFETNDLGAAVRSAQLTAGHDGVRDLHAAPGPANDQLAGAAHGFSPASAAAEGGANAASGAAANAASGAAADPAYGATGGAVDVLYSNPLPHVLILTAIVVGVATTAVGLALAVRIREAYGTIEEDELEAMDNVAEFGADAEAGS